MLDPEFVIAVHDEIIAQFGGLPGLARVGRAGVEAALQRIAHQMHYAGLDDVFGIAALYGVVIAHGHIFNDGNKRTGLTCALAYLRQQGFRVPACAGFEEVMVDVARGRVGQMEFAAFLYGAWDQSRTARIEAPSLSGEKAVEADHSGAKSTWTPAIRHTRR